MQLTNNKRQLLTFTTSLLSGIIPGLTCSPFKCQTTNMPYCIVLGQVILTCQEIPAAGIFTGYIPFLSLKHQASMQ